MTQERADLILQLAEEYIKNRCTIRQVAQMNGIGKSTVWVMLSKELPKVSKEKAKLVKDILRENKKVAPLRGGLANKRRHERS